MIVKIYFTLSLQIKQKKENYIESKYELTTILIRLASYEKSAGLWLIQTFTSVLLQNTITSCKRVVLIKHFLCAMVMTFPRKRLIAPAKF